MDERFKNKYMDTNCLTHVLPYTFSENGILFTAYMRYLNLVKEIEALHAIYSTVNRDVQSDT